MKRTFFYILSPSYSGSTLITSLLARHPDVVTIGEVKATQMGDVAVYRCSCGELILQCPFWRAMSATLAGRGIAFDVRNFGTHFRAPTSPLTDRVMRARVRGALFESIRQVALSLIPGARSTLNGLIARNAAVIDTLMEHQPGRVFLDSSKDPVRLLYLRDDAKWHVKVVHLVRDGRGTANSYMTHYGVDIGEAAREWRDTHLECERMRATFPHADTLFMRYEDFCADVPAGLEQLLTFLGLPASDLISVSALGSGTGTPEMPGRRTQHILGNPMRLRGLDTIAIDDRWRTDLGEQALVSFERIGGALNQRYGYV